MPQILSITQINEYLRGKMDEDRLLNQVAVRGEISNYKLYPSGHHYFTLKDENAALKCVLFKGSAVHLRFRPENGMKVIAMGRITVYPRDGAFQLYVSNMTVDGVGDLYAAFEQRPGAQKAAAPIPGNHRHRHQLRRRCHSRYAPDFKQAVSSYKGSPAAGSCPGRGSAGGDRRRHPVRQLPLPGGSADRGKRRRLH